MPGLGARNVERILAQRRFARLRLDDLRRLRISMRKVRPFVVTLDHRPAMHERDSARLQAEFAATPAQADLFASPP